MARLVFFFEIVVVKSTKRVISKIVQRAMIDRTVAFSLLQFVFLKIEKRTAGTDASFTGVVFDENL